MYTYFDIHTHSAPIEDSEIVAIINLQAPNYATEKEHLYSYGIHPYDVAIAQKQWMTVDVAQNNIIAVGEIGLDFRFQNTIPLQLLWFKQQLAWAEQVDLPVIIHCVKAVRQTIDLLKKSGGQRFVFHGFNNSLSDAQLILENGGYLSFGERLISSTVNQQVFSTVFQTHPDKIVLETDTSSIPIQTIYHAAAQRIDTAMTDMQQQIQTNFSTFFNRHD